MVTKERIKDFFEGFGTEKYIVNIETNRYNNIAECVIHDPVENKKKIKKIQFSPFIYVKDLKKLGHRLYSGNKELLLQSMTKYGISTKKLETGNQPRLENGYKFMFSSSISYQSIYDFFNNGGIDVYKNRDLFYSINLDEQFLISSGNRLYKGFDFYDNIHKLTFDIETTGLNPKRARIFQIGIKDNRGFERVLEVTKPNDDISEKNLIIDFFNIIDEIKPAIICGYNSEEFDIKFILDRAEITGVNMSQLPTTLNKTTGGYGEYKNTLHKQPSSVKFGNETKKYDKTVAWGYSYVDILHAAKKAQSINSDIENTRLKYICKFNGIAKKDRMYVEGDKIFKIWNENKKFVINKLDNTYVEIPEKYQNNTVGYFNLLNIKYKEKITNGEIIFDEIEGKDIVRRYLLDDLWETEKVDSLYNESSFQLSKIVPTNYQRICTMGTAAVWNLLMTAWSYENNLAIPYTQTEGTYPGGLTRVFKVGFNKLIEKIDFSGLYPSIQLKYDVFPLFDITGVMKSMLTYTVGERNIYKVKAKEDGLEESLKKFFESKQLPLKILNNSLYGALGSGIAFQWADVTCAARVTCIGRLHLRKLVKWMGRFITPLLAVTDGVNFSVPKVTKVDINANPLNEDTLIDDAWIHGTKTGYNALIQKYNDEVLDKEYMKIDAEDRWQSCLNLSRINYANLKYPGIDKKTKKPTEAKIKLVGNTIKSKTMPEYIKEFLNKGIKMILEDKPVEFVEYYYKYMADIYYENIPLKKISSKSKIKSSVEDYIKRGCDATGKLKGKKAYLELLIYENLSMEEYKEYVSYVMEFDETTKLNNGNRLNDKKKYTKLINDLFDENLDIEKIRIETIKSIESKDWYNTQVSKSIMQYQTKKDFMVIINHIMAHYQQFASEYIVKYESNINNLFSQVKFVYDPDSLVYYYNVGDTISQGDTKFIKNEDGTYSLSCKRISESELEKNPNVTGSYNKKKYVADFNKRVQKILTGFSENVQKTLLVKDPAKRMVYEENEVYLTSFEKDTMDEFFLIEKKEESFWNSLGYDPTEIFDGFKYEDLSGVEEYKKIFNIYKETFNKKGYIFKRIDDIKDEKDFFLYKRDDVYQIRYILDGYSHVYKEFKAQDVINK